MSSVYDKKWVKLTFSVRIQDRVRKEEVVFGRVMKKSSGGNFYFFTWVLIF